VDLSLILRLPACVAAEKLIGWQLLHDHPGGKRGGIIVETEAYTLTDPASHSFRGNTARTKPMFGPGGTIYIYFTYGMHYCLNIVTDAPGEAILVRALEPTVGLNLMRQSRGPWTDQKLCNGPAKLVQALSLPLAYNNKHLSQTKLLLLPPMKSYKTYATRRVGITKAIDTPWRFCAQKSLFLSKDIPPHMPGHL